MKRIMLLAGCSIILSCTSMTKSRGPASEEGVQRYNLAMEDGSVKSYLGEARYHRRSTSDRNCKAKQYGCDVTTKMRAIRIYLEAVPGEKDSYYSVIVEYADLIKMFPEYLAGRQLPKLSEIIGHLNNITDKISAHKLVPIAGHVNLWEIQKAKVNGKNIVFESYSPARSLVLSDSTIPEQPLAGARIVGFPGQTYFQPASEEESSQLKIAKIVYEKIGLDSSWREDFVQNQYFAAYLKTDDVVLTLTEKEGAPIGVFKESEVGDKMVREEGLEARKKVFTNPLSAGLNGTYDVSEPINRMFLFHKRKLASEELDHRIGLFIDVFDATKKLNQDVVELAFINPDDPEDFLMYYEADPE